MTSHISDTQGRPPATRLPLTRVGVTSLKRILRLAPKNASGQSSNERLFFAEMDLFAHLSADQSGVHMSRFVEQIEQIASKSSERPTPDIETLAESMAADIARTQGAERSEVRIRARFQMKKTTPVSRMEVSDLYTFIGIAVSSGDATRRAVGVEAEGFTVCPCAQEMTASWSRDLLVKEGFSQRDADRIVSLLPLASHTQRGRATVMVGTDMRIKAESLVRIAEASMSSEIYELLKRPDELDVVRRGHFAPRFAEDSVREMLRLLAESPIGLPDDAFIVARQENFESIHSHNAYAERCGSLGDIRSELSGSSDRHATGPTSLDEWMDGIL